MTIFRSQNAAVEALKEKLKDGVGNLPSGHEYYKMTALSDELVTQLNPGEWELSDNRKLLEAAAKRNMRESGWRVFNAQQRMDDWRITMDFAGLI